MQHTQCISTRGQMVVARFTDVLVTGLAPDGGLAIPNQLPALSLKQIKAQRPPGYTGLATEIIGLSATDIPREDLTKLTQVAYGPQRFLQLVVPVTELDRVADGLALVGLSEGPTTAFKDLAMQFLGQVIPYMLAKHGQVLNILGATSGGTGSAAEHAFRGQEGISVFMLSPTGHMNPVQHAQTHTLQNANIHNITMRGVFDNRQALVRALSNDAELKAAHHLGAVSSINIGRIAAQAVYYMWSWLWVTDAMEEGRRAGYRVDVCMPSGNFGNIYAGFLAWSVGMPIRRLILATNENDIPEELFSTGICRSRSAEDTLATSSPSADILKASNLERFIWALLGPEVSVQRWAGLETTGTLDLRDQLPRLHEEFGFVVDTSSHAGRLEVIRTVKERSGQLIDPHTADGIMVALRIMETGFPILVIETIKTTKFPRTVAGTLGSKPETPGVVADLLARPQKVGTVDNEEAPLRVLVEKRALTC